VSADAQAYPFDPPLTETGLEQARACGERLRQLGPPQDGWNVAISSPFFRCVQTAVEICAATGASLIIDQDWGEVRFHEFMDGAAFDEPQGLTRAYQFLARYVALKGVNLRNANALRGKEWNEAGLENCKDARERYAKKFVVCLDRAMLSQSSFIVVSHGESIPACLPLFPAYRGAEVTAVPYCGMVVGRLEQTQEKTFATRLEKARSTSDAYATSNVLDGLTVIETTCEVLLKSAVKHERNTLPAWIRKEPFHFRAPSRVRKTRGIRNSDSSTFASRDKPLSPLPDVEERPSPLPDVEERPSPSVEKTIEKVRAVSSTTEDDVDYKAGIEDMINLPPAMNREVSGASSQKTAPMTGVSIGESTLLLGGSQASSAESRSTGFSTFFEMSGLLTDPTFQKIPSCRKGKNTQPKGQTCSPCSRLGPFALMRSAMSARSPKGTCSPKGTGSPKDSKIHKSSPFSLKRSSKESKSEPSLAVASADAAESTDYPSEQTKRSLRKLRRSSNESPAVSFMSAQSPEQTSASSAKMTSPPLLMAQLPAAGSEDSMNLFALKANSLWKRRHL
jgi:broad specificity phosphatase PhoE